MLHSSAARIAIALGLGAVTGGARKVLAVNLWAASDYATPEVYPIEDLTLEPIPDEYDGRQEFDTSVSAAAGLIGPWQTSALRYARTQREGLDLWVTSLGFGSWDAQRADRGRTLRIPSSVVAVTTGWRWGFPFAPWLGAETGLEALSWRGTVTGTDASAASSYHFLALAPTGKLVVRWQVLRQWFIEYTVLGVSKPYVLVKNISQDTTDRIAVLDRRFSAPLAFGFINLAIGHSF